MLRIGLNVHSKALHNIFPRKEYHVTLINLGPGRTHFEQEIVRKVLIELAREFPAVGAEVDNDTQIWNLQNIVKIVYVPDVVYELREKLLDRLQKKRVYQPPKKVEYWNPHITFVSSDDPYAIPPIKTNNLRVGLNKLYLNKNGNYEYYKLRGRRHARKSNPC